MIRNSQQRIQMKKPILNKMTLLKIKRYQQGLFQKGMGAIFQKKGKEILKKGKIFENFGKNVQNLKIF